MKNKTIKILVIGFLLFSLTGCTKYIKDDNKKVIQNTETGQSLPANILCQPEDEITLKIYDEYNKTTKNEKVDIQNLPKCKNLQKKTKKYEGLWTTIFVQPLAWVIIQLGKLFNTFGLGLIVCTLIIRGACYPLTKKSLMQSENMKKAKSKIDKLEKKYAGKNDKESMMAKSQEMMMIYKEYNISPMSGCLFAFIQIPLFFAFYEAITRIPAIFEENFLSFQLGTSPYVAIFQQGKYQYIILIVLVVLATYFSFKNNMSTMNGDQAKSMKTMSYFMVIMMSITSFSVSSGIAIYWITSNVFTIVQNYFVRRGVQNARKQSV